MTDVVTIIASAGTAYTAYISAIEDGYGAIQEGVKIWENEKNKLLSAGQGGKAPSTGYPSNLPYFSVPKGGGGGGGAGKMQIKSLPDAAGGGGGGGGAGAPSLKIVTAGYVKIGTWSPGSPIGSIIGKGGNGGHGGDGGGGWLVGQAAPGGGGGGGNGAQVQIIAREVQNWGKINLKGGLGGASGRIESQDSGYYVIKDSFGESGKNGILRVDCTLNGNRPQNDLTLYNHSGYSLYSVGAATNSPFCTKKEVEYKPNHWIWVDWCFNPQPGLNTFNKYNAEIHPWQKQFVFYYPGWQDSDGDGFNDGLELTLGTSPNNPDSDGDGLYDSSEVGFYFTDPLKPDTDGDGYSDGYEVAKGSNPKDPASRPAYSITVTKAGAGGGLVTSSPLGLDCGSTCQATFDRNLKVTLQASPSTGSYFTGWSGGGCTGTAPSCTINSLSTDTTVVANFELQKTLTVTKTGAGSGVVTSSPPGVDCGSTCQATYTHGTMVDLHAVASLGYYLAGWSGGGCSGNATICTVTIAADTTVTANFEIPIPGALMTVARKNHTATLLSDGRVFLAGGWDSTGNILPSAELYDSATSTFSSTGSMATGRVGHTATLLPNGKVLLTGGEESNNPHYNPYTLSTAELYDHTTGTFDPTGYLMEGIGYMREAHVGQTATLLPFEPAMVLIIGGWPVIPWYQAGSSEIYSVDGGWFGSAAESYRMIEERSDHTATLLLDGKVLVAGGSDANGTYLDSAELYTINELDAFSATGSMATVRGGGHTATLLPDGKVLVVGGSVVDFGILSSAELYDPATGMFSFAGDMTAARAGHTATLLNNGKVLIAGGHGYYDEGVWSSAELYDPATETFTATGSMMVTRAYHTATLIKNGKVLIAGGYSDVDGALSSAEIYDPETGTFSSTAPSDN